MIQQFFLYMDQLSKLFLKIILFFSIVSIYEIADFEKDWGWELDARFKVL